MVDTDKAMQEFLARGGTITRCPASNKQARSLRAMRRDEEMKVAAEAEGDREVQEVEAVVRQRLSEIFG